jgi:hypothetical protein
MNTVAEFCELLGQLDVGKPKARETRILSTRSMPESLNGGRDNDSQVPLLVTLESSDGETSDSSDTEDGSWPSALLRNDIVTMDKREEEPIVTMDKREEEPIVSPCTRHVSFHAVVQVREYALTVGALTNMEKGELPLQLDWGCADTVYRLSQNQSVRHQEPPRLSLYMRRARLKCVSSYTDYELDQIATAAKLVSVLNFFRV